MDDTLYKVAFASIRGMGIELAQRMLDVIPSENEFFTMPEKEIKAITGGRSRIYDSSYRNQQLDKAKRELEFINNKNIGLLYYTQPNYPTRLLEACDAPLLLYTSGNCNLNSAHVVSIVGTRHATNYGIRMCQEIVQQLSERLDDLIVVSGLAYGIDIAAHRAAVKNNVPTVAIMARGLNKIYPASHRNDAVDIVRHGGMIATDYQSQDEIHKGNFLARNRIIAGLADCTVVVESASSGGALVTASLASSYNRDVYAVPGRVGDEFSRGCNKLIHNNQAMSITCADDIIEAMRWTPKTSPAQQMELFPTLTAEEQKIVDLLQQEGDLHINIIASHTGMPIYRIMASLVELDCKGIVISLPGSRYTLHRK